MINKKTLLVSLVSFGLLFGIAEDCLADVAAQLAQAEACGNNKDYNCAETIYTDIVQNYPGSNEALAAQRELTGLYIDMGNDAKAREALEKLIADFSEHPGLPGALSYIATRYRWSSKYEEAASIYQQIIQQYPDSSYAEMAQFEFPKMDVLSLVEWGIEDGNDAEAQAAIDNLIADFDGHQPCVFKELIGAHGGQYIVTEPFQNPPGHSTDMHPRQHSLPDMLRMAHGREHYFGRIIIALRHIHALFI